MSNAAAALAPVSALDHYARASLAMLHRALAGAMPALCEPADAAWERAWPRLAFVVETLVGVAAGAVVGRVASAIVRTVGSELPPAFAATYRREVAALRASRGEDPAIARAPYLRDASARPLADELASQLHARLISACRRAADALAAIIACVPATRDVERILALVARDPLLGQLFGEHLVVGWAAYTAAVTDRPLALPAAGAVADTWRAWLRRVRGEPTPVLRQSDYIMTIG